MRKEIIPNIALEIAEFGGGCFWEMQHVLNETPGVLITTAGFNGGIELDPAKHCDTAALCEAGYVEVVKVEFNPGEVKFSDLLQIYRTHIAQHVSPEPLERSAVFPHSTAQRDLCNGLTVEEQTFFIAAPENQQDYLSKPST